MKYKQRMDLFYSYMDENNYKEADKVLTEIEAIVGTTDSDIVAYFTTCTGEDNFPREVYFEVTRI